VTTIVIFIVAVSIATLLAWSDLRWFALYSFSVVVLLILGGLERLWKFMRVSHFSNAAKTLAVARRVGVSQKDFDAVVDEIKKSVPADIFKGLMKDYRDL
jgi:hypothetical protein